MISGWKWYMFLNDSTLTLGQVYESWWWWWRWCWWWWWWRLVPCASFTSLGFHWESAGVLPRNEGRWIPIYLLRMQIRQSWVVVSFFMFIRILGTIPILTNIFQRGWNHHPDRVHSSNYRCDSVGCTNQKHRRCDNIVCIQLIVSSWFTKIGSSQIHVLEKDLEKPPQQFAATSGWEIGAGCTTYGKIGAGEGCQLALLSSRNGGGNCWMIRYSTTIHRDLCELSPGLPPPLNLWFFPISMIKILR